MTPGDVGGFGGCGGGGFGGGGGGGRGGGRGGGFGGGAAAIAPGDPARPASACA